MKTAIRRIILSFCVALSCSAGVASTASAQAGSACAGNVVYCIPSAADQSAGEKAVAKLYPDATVNFSASVGGGLIYTVTFPPLSDNLSPDGLANAISKQPITVLYLPNGGTVVVQQSATFPSSFAVAAASSTIPGVKQKVRPGGKLAVKVKLSKIQAVRLKKSGKITVTSRITIKDKTGSHTKTIKTTIKLKKKK